MNIVATIYYHGGMLVATTPTIDRTTRTVRHLAEAQRDAYEALTENLAAAQRRSIGLANGRLEFMRLQEETARAAQEWFANGVRLLQQRTAEFVQAWTSDVIEAISEQTEHSVRMAEAGRLAGAHPGVDRGLPRLLFSLRLRSGELKECPAGHPAGTAGDRAGSPAGAAGCRGGHRADR